LAQPHALADRGVTASRPSEAAARSGDRQPVLPHHPFDAELIFDTVTVVENDPRRAFRELWV
jgi:hypothetical protein